MAARSGGRTVGWSTVAGRLVWRVGRWDRALVEQPPTPHREPAPAVRIDATEWVAGASTALVLLLVAGALFRWGGLTVAYPGCMCVGSAAVIVVTLIRSRRDHVLATEEGLVVVTRRGEQLHRWMDVLEVGWVTPLPVFPPQRPGVVVRPAAGGPWAVPGPNAPTRVATLAVYGRRGRRRAQDLLAGECARHGIPFTADGVTMLTNAPPGSPYRNTPRRLSRR